MRGFVIGVSIFDGTGFQVLHVEEWVFALDSP